MSEEYSEWGFRALVLPNTLAVERPRELKFAARCENAWVPHSFQQKRVGDGGSEARRVEPRSVPHPSLREQWGTRFCIPLSLCVSVSLWFLLLRARHPQDRAN